jgi:hypothetical protein
LFAFLYLPVLFYYTWQAADTQTLAIATAVKPNLMLPLLDIPYCSVQALELAEFSMEGLGKLACKFGVQKLKFVMSKVLTFVAAQSPETLGNLPALTELLEGQSEESYEVGISMSMEEDSGHTVPEVGRGRSLLGIAVGRHL